MLSCAVIMQIKIESLEILSICIASHLGIITIYILSRFSDHTHAYIHLHLLLDVPTWPCSLKLSRLMYYNQFLADIFIAEDLSPISFCSVIPVIKNTYWLRNLQIAKQKNSVLLVPKHNKNKNLIHGTYIEKINISKIFDYSSTYHYNIMNITLSLDGKIWEPFEYLFQLNSEQLIVNSLTDKKETY